MSGALCLLGWMIRVERVESEWGGGEKEERERKVNRLPEVEKELSQSDKLIFFLLPTAGCRSIVRGKKTSIAVTD